eukprot:CAMPEP_0115094294 /NCGR_PEP_ID=MMETSP0227-20121206/28241_1 /TAXON_ID=89957 /ORGANISM="Polarella glacialis, Strain CCMP 1383" /LENGTH=718 /DNA_ID=CAMNT_0002487207 /DNA_START=78 /DNA_END=2234 /DNA_ORIENTATION=+
MKLSIKHVSSLLGAVTLGLFLRNLHGSFEALHPSTGRSSSEAPKGRRRPGGKVTFSGVLNRGNLQASENCSVPAAGRSHWRQVEPKDLEIIRSKPSGPWGAAITNCEMRGEAMVFRLDLRKATKAGGQAYEIPFPHYIVADEGGSWRETRSTLQLFTVGESGWFHPMGPAHSRHDDISSKGNGAYSHWRHALTSGPSGASHIRFSTPRNVELGDLHGVAVVVFPMAPPMGWIEFAGGKKVTHEEIFREMFLQTFATVGASTPHLIEEAAETRAGTRYLWRIGGNGEFSLPLKDGELYEKRMPYQIAEWYSEFEKQGGILFPPPESYKYYQNKVGLARLFQETKVKTPKTWVFSSFAEAESAQGSIDFPVIIKDPYGFSSLGLLQAADVDEFLKNVKRYFEDALAGVEAIVQSKVIALREARVTYIDGRPFHAYWRIRQSLTSASAASNLGGYQDFNFPLNEIAPYVEEFARITGIPVGGVDFIWQEAEPDVKSTPFTLEVSPTSDLNPPAPASWSSTYAEFKYTPGFRTEYLAVRRQWTDLMALAVIDRYRQERKHLFVDIDNVVSLSMDRMRRLKGKKEAYSAVEVMKDQAVPGAAEALEKLGSHFFIRFLTARGSYEDPFNVTQTWLRMNGFTGLFDDLIVVDGPESKVAHMSSETLLVDDFTLGHETEKPFQNTKFMEKLRKAELPFVVFPLGGSWDDVMPELLRQAGTSDDQGG